MKRLALALILACLPLAAKTPAILVSDIGTDIDDCWALATLLRSPELDLKLVLTDSADTVYRAQVAAKFLEASGRSDVPVAIGANIGPRDNDKKTLSDWIRGYDLHKYPGKVYEDGVGALIDTVRRSTEPVTVIAIGPVPNLALAVSREPSLAAKCRLVGMFGSIDSGYGGGPVSAEWNVKVDPAALRTVLGAPWRDVLFTPLDTCGVVDLDGERYHRLWCDTADPMVRALITSYCSFAPRQDWMVCDYFALRSSTLYDAVAAYLACSESFVETQTVRFDVTDDGYTRRSQKGAFQARFALRWRDKEGFKDWLTGRLLGH